MSGTVTAKTATAVEFLGRFAAGLRLDRLPPEVVEKVRCNLLHDLACALAAHSVGDEAWPLTRGLRPAQATLICGGEKVPAEHAAFANAVLVHGRAQDDTHFAAKCHAGSATIPAVLALAEATGQGGERVVPGLVAGYEVATAVGELFADATTARGLRASMLYGTLGAAAASAVTLGLDTAGTTNAIAIATSFAGGLGQAWVEGSSEWRWELGMAARNGVLAARLAQAGARGAAHAFEGSAGFVKAFTGEADWTAPEDWELGERWRVLDVIYKPYPVCNITQTPVALAIELATRYELTAADIDAVRLWLNPADRSYPGTLNAGPFEDVGATLMSARYCVAMGLRDRTATLAGLRAFEDEELLGLVKRIDVIADERLSVLAARLEVRTLDGRRFEAELIPDDATYAWDWDGVRANARRLAAEMRDGGAVDALEDLLSRIERLPSIAPLMDVLA
ncbi:MAG: MmgE/PrpD family protein [Microbispora sp.]|nr:MmgE/PrpD family protein [Microbispora sp.]